MSLKNDIQTAINKHSAENGSNTPDFMLAEFLVLCLAAYDQTTTRREKWYGRGDKPVETNLAPPKDEKDTDPPIEVDAEFDKVGKVYCKPFSYLSSCGGVYMKGTKCGDAKVLDIRGWGYLTGTGGLAMPEEKATPIQDAFGNKVAELLNDSFASYINGKG